MKYEREAGWVDAGDWVGRFRRKPAQDFRLPLRLPTACRGSHRAYAVQAFSSVTQSVQEQGISTLV
jgi:hypothetical protein